MIHKSVHYILTLAGYMNCSWFGRSYYSELK